VVAVPIAVAVLDGDRARQLPAARGQAPQRPPAGRAGAGRGAGTTHERLSPAHPDGHRPLAAAGQEQLTQAGQGHPAGPRIAGEVGVETGLTGRRGGQPAELQQITGQSISGTAAQQPGGLDEPGADERIAQQLTVDLRPVPLGVGQRGNRGFPVALLLAPLPSQKLQEQQVPDQPARDQFPNDSGATAAGRDGGEIRIRQLNVLDHGVAAPVARFRSFAMRRWTCRISAVRSAQKTDGFRNPSG
jgi:hypothetical protein